MPTNNQSAVKLRIVVVGSGVAGLGAASSLGLYGHEVTVIERSEHAFQEAQPDSGGIRCPPNMTRILKMEPGFLSCHQSVGTDGSGLRFFEGSTGEVSGDMPFPPEMMADLGSPFLMMQRSDYCKLAYDLCSKLRVKFKFGTSVVALDTSNSDFVAVELDDGETEQADLVVGADGYNSVLRSVVVEDEEDEELVAVLSGASIAIPVEKLLEDPELAPLCESTRLNVWTGNRSSITGGMHGSQHYDISFLSMSKHHGMHDTERRTKFTLEDFASFDVQDYEPRIHKLVKLGSSSYFTTQTLRALSTVIDPSSRVVLIGDAARAPPMHGTHNSAMALEDAVTLGSILNYLTDRRHLPRLLQGYEEIREPRTKDTQREQLNGQILVSLEAGPHRDGRDAMFRMTLENPVLDDAMLHMSWGNHLKQFDYDAFEAVADWQLNWGRFSAV
ncbi:hypothetical protein C8J56DRAFT_1043680 [Mycena floridula]|nr:hypothetical protein C8J56DRAFT_1043680 [Mycena floridula]